MILIKITHYRKTTDSYLLLQAPQGRQETFTQYERKLDSIHKNHKANETEVGLNVILSSSLFLGFKHWHIFGSDFALKSGLCHLPSCSSILSHSSRMKCLMWRKLSVLLRVSARILPGVPTTIWGEFFFSSSSSFFIDSPPKNTATCRKTSIHHTVWAGRNWCMSSSCFTLTVGMYFENLSYSLLIWNASSLVWHITRTETCT